MTIKVQEECAWYLANNLEMSVLEEDNINVLELDIFKHQSNKRIHEICKTLKTESSKCFSDIDETVIFVL